MSVHTQIKLVERYKSLSGGAGAKTTAGPKGGSAVNKATVEKSTFRKTKDDAYQEELARRRAAKQAEARHMETLKSFKGSGAPPAAHRGRVQRVRLRGGRESRFRNEGGVHGR